MDGLVKRLERLELKYLVSEGTAARVRRDLEPYCQADAHNLDRGRTREAWRPGYEVRSLYLDTPSLAFHRAKERGDPERRKLRIRCYPATGARTLELKERSQDMIQKTRAAIAPGPLATAVSGDAKLQAETPASRRFLDRFAGLASASGAEPSLLVHYDREAYHSRTTEYARATFDRELGFQRTDDWTLDGDTHRWSALADHLIPDAPDPFVVLELKCEATVPHWIVDLIRRHDLRRRSFSKYSIGIHLTSWLDGSPLGGRSLRGVLA